MSIERVRNYFKTWDMEDRILEFPVSSATVELAAQAVSGDPELALSMIPASRRPGSHRNGRRRQGRQCKIQRIFPH